MGMEWLRDFPRVIAERGRDYWRRGLVRNLEGNLDVWQADVLGTRIYEVCADLSNSQSAEYSCNCPMGENGERCKHMAALRFAIESRKAETSAAAEEKIGSQIARGYAAVSAPKKRTQTVGMQSLFPLKTLRPFNRNAETDTEDDYFTPYRYFDLSRAAGFIEVSETDLQQAREIIETDERYRFHTRAEESDDGSKWFRLLLRLSEGSRTITVFLSLGREQLYECSCDHHRCWNKNHYRNAPGDTVCVHVLAGLLLLERELAETQEIDITDPVTRRFLKSFVGKPGISRARTEQTGRALRLEPRLEMSASGVSFSLRAGFDRMYVVRQLNSFVQAHEENVAFALSKKETADFSRDRIAEEDEALYDFIRSAVFEERERANLLYETTGHRHSARFGRVSLRGAHLDAFFERYEGRQVYSDEHPERLIALRDGEVRLKLSLEPIRMGNRFEGVSLAGNLPDLVEGARALYALDSKGPELLRLPAKQGVFLRRLLSFRKSGRLSLTIGRRNLAAFYRDILPGIQRYADIEDHAAEAERYVPPRPEFLFRLDATVERLTCEARVSYGERAGVPKLRWTDGIGMYRAMEEEERAAEAVRAFFPAEDPATGLFFAERSDETVWDLFESGLDRLIALGEVQGSDAFRALRVKNRWRITAGLSLESGILQLSLGSQDVPEDELLAVLQSYAAKKRFHRLKSGMLLGLSGESAESLGALFEAGGVSLKDFVRGKMHIPAYRALYLSEMLEGHREFAAKTDANFRMLVKNLRDWRASETEPPETLAPVLRDYQKEGFRWLNALREAGFGGILADDMGLGKTLQMIALLLREKERSGRLAALIVCPASLVYNWLYEIERFAPSLSACVVAGTPRERTALLHDRESHDIIITSYDLMRRDVDRYEDLFFDYMVLDEAQYIKNHASMGSKAVKVIKSACRFALTGTPIENRLSELWSIFDFLMPGFLFPYETFRRTFETPILHGEDGAAAERLRRLVGPFVLRRLKGDVLPDLPEKTEEARYAVLEGEQRKLYDAQTLKLRRMIQGSGADFSKDRIRILAELTRLRQLSCDPAMIFEDYKGGSAKRVALWELIDSAMDGGHRMLVFSQFTGALDLVEEDLKERNIAYEKLTGETPKGERLSMAQRFNGGNTPVFLISLKAGGTGLNLTGADLVVLLDPWWNAAAETQAADRAHRIGQKHPVTVYRIIAKDTIEERILELQEKKRQLADDILSGSASGAAALSREELLELLEQRNGTRQWDASAGME